MLSKRAAFLRLEGKMKTESTKLYINVRQVGGTTSNPYELARKMNALLESALNKNAPTHMGDLRMGSFHPADRTKTYYKYKELEEKLLKMREDGCTEEEEDALLDEMDVVWYSLPMEEYRLLDHHMKKIVVPPTRFKVGQIIDDWTEKWEIVSIDGDDMVIRVLETGPNKQGSIGSYLDVGKEYKVFRHQNEHDETWEVDPKGMKRDFSQVLLFWFDDDDNPVVDLDS